MFARPDVHFRIVLCAKCGIVKITVTTDDFLTKMFIRLLKMKSTKHSQSHVESFILIPPGTT